VIKLSNIQNISDRLNSKIHEIYSTNEPTNILHFILKNLFCTIEIEYLTWGKLFISM